ncbi:DUF1080 domain-containing protein [Verrucomicrobia bacterium]|jgi:hypothetical protein|nr:DUF1080 domain-containing protein [Verrucomicrobiota bacterium]
MTSRTIYLGALSTALVVASFLSLDIRADHHNEQPKIGYSDTPFIPGQKWRVHDGTRPQPPVVTPGTTFSHSAPAPSDATILFDGRDLSNFEKGNKQPAGWKVENGYMEVAPGAGGIQTKEHFADFQLHIEFATPYKVEGDSQGRGNSGVIVFGMYEIQVLDSFHNPTYPDGQAGAMYGQLPPKVNASLPPGAWQSYDIIFETARWDGDTLVKKANLTVIHNGVVLHHKQEYNGPSLHRQVGTYSKPHPSHGPIHLQDHNNPMRFRNIWIRDLGVYDK